MFLYIIMHDPLKPIVTYVSPGLIQKQKKFYVLSTGVVYVFTDLRTNSDYFPIQHS